jgi:hypothetical protein
MRYLFIELVGMKRLMHGQAHIFRMDLTQKVQLILGGNGSGKSTLMREISPLPADGDDFAKGGGKTIGISDKGHIYELKNVFDTKAGKHSFEKDGVELNPGGTVTVQKQLVLAEFGITEQIRDLLLGEEKFCDMKPMDRREWLTNLSDTNFDYALRIFQDVTSEWRGTSSAIKNVKQRITTETSKIITPEEQVKLRSEVEAIHIELNGLQELRAPVEFDTRDLERQQATGLERLNQMSLKLLRLRTVAPLTAYGAEEAERDDWGILRAPIFTNTDQIDRYCAVLKERIAAEEALINQAVKDHGKLKSNFEILKKTGADGIKSLSDKLNHLVQVRQEKRDSRKLKLDILDPQAAMVSFDSCHDTLFEVFSVIAENEDKRFSQAELQKLQEKLKERRETTLKYRNQLAKLEAQRAHQEQHQSNGHVECPSCHHKFTPGFTEAVLKHVKEQLERGNLKLKEVEGEVETLERTLEEFTTYGQLFRRYTDCRKNFQALSVFFESLDSRNVPIAAPRMVLPILVKFKQDLEIELEISKIDKQIEETKQLMSQAAMLGNASLAETQEQMEALAVTVETMTHHLDRLRGRLAEHQQYHRDMVAGLELGRQIEELVNNLTQVNENLLETMKRETINHVIRQLHQQLGKKEEVLNAVKIQQAVVAELTKELSSLEVKEKALKAVSDELSPVDGLIAEGLMGFIRGYVQQMNQFIKKIWTYPLQVKNCGVSDENGVELDYRFPMLVDSPENIKKDVSKGSSGMKDIINFAFRRVAMKYCGLGSSPLFLDEFAITLDKEHRDGATRAIKSMIEAENFTQLFMISHYESMYSAFTNADICVLDTKNIVVPDIYNRHVTIQ